MSKLQSIRLAATESGAAPNPANDAELGPDAAGSKQGKDLSPDRLRLSMTLKVSLWFGVPLIVGFIALFKLVFDSQQQFQTQQMNDFARVITDQLAATSVEPLFADAHMELGILVSQIPLNNTLIGVAIYDHQQQLVASAGQVPASEQLDPTIPISSLDPTALVAGDSTDALPTQVLVYSKPVIFRETTGGHALVVFDKSSLDSEIRQVQYALFSIALFMIVFLAAVVFYFSHRITAPIRNIVDAANRIDSGDISPILERRNDELGQLINAINNMTRGLAEKSQLKDVLDRFVAPELTEKILSQLDAVNFKGENVNATVLFADIVGFTRLSEKLEPGTVSELLNEYFGYYSACAKLYFGTVDKFLGDCIMIAFGASREDHQHQYHAACCALLMQQLTDRINAMRSAQGLDTIHIRIGINSGPMLAGLLGSRDRLEYTVVGDSVNLASRLCNEAGSGEIILQESLGEAIERNHALELDNPRTIKVRGKTEPVTIYNLHGVEQAHTHGNRAMIEDLLERAGNSLTAI